MNIYFAQIYIQAGASFPFSCEFQKYLSTEISSMTEPSVKFISLYGSEWNIMFRISAKKEIELTEIKGPTLFKKNKDIEYTIFLPYQVVLSDSNAYQKAFAQILSATCRILESLDITTTNIKSMSHHLSNEIFNNSKMFDSHVRA